MIQFHIEMAGDSLCHVSANVNGKIYVECVWKHANEFNEVRYDTFDQCVDAAKACIVQNISKDRSEKPSVLIHNAITNCSDLESSSYLGELVDMLWQCQKLARYIELGQELKRVKEVSNG